MEQVGQAFDHIRAQEDIKELSAVIYPDSFFCGYWGEDSTLLRADAHTLDAFGAVYDNWKQNYGELPLKIVSTCIPYVQIPQEEFEPAFFELYFKGLYDIRKMERHSASRDTFRHVKAQTLHYIPLDIREKSSVHPGGTQLAHISTAMSNYAYLVSASCVIYTQKNMLHICCHRDGSFLFYNQFYCADVNDYIYFSLMVLQHFNMDYGNMEVHMGGEIDRSSRIYVKLRYYIPGLRMMDELVQTTAETGSPGQLYFDLFLARTCV